MVDLFVGSFCSEEPNVLEAFHKNQQRDTPLKINMEPKNHPIEKEKHLPSTSSFGLQNVSFAGRTTSCFFLM